jgi:hypothetical protein
VQVANADERRCVSIRLPLLLERIVLVDSQTSGAASTSNRAPSCEGTALSARILVLAKHGLAACVAAVDRTGSLVI